MRGRLSVRKIDLHVVALLQRQEWHFVSRDGVAGHVGESRQDAAAQGAAVDVHVAGRGPGVARMVVELHVGADGVAIEAPDDEQFVVDDFDAKVTAGGRHRRYFLPGVCPWVVDLRAVLSVDAIKATNLSKEQLKAYFNILANCPVSFIPLVI